METLATTENTEWKELHLEATKKQNTLLDLEIEMKKVQLEIQKVQLRQLGDKGE